MELKFAINGYFKQLFQNLKPKLQYSKNRIFVTSHFGTLLRGGVEVVEILYFILKFFKEGNTSAKMLVFKGPSN